MASGAQKRSRTFFIAISVSAALVVIAFTSWLNYGWILWNTPAWSRQVEGFALRTFGDAWERESRELAGSHAIDCGRVSVGSGPDAASQCALKAFHNGQPFRVRYDLQGFDSNVSAGLVFTPEGKMYELTFDGDPSGRGGTSWSRQRTSQMICPVPVHLYLNPNGRLDCFTVDPGRPHDVMSPNLESY